MNRDRIMNTIGFSLVAFCFLWAAWRIMDRGREAADPDRVVIRFAHWQLESGIRGAFDELIRQYEERHPHVRVEQMLIPERVYSNWLITQLVGGTAPDLIEIGRPMSDERMARYFTPLMKEVNQPNPYNEGTELEGLPWRDTFVDGLAGSPSYNPGLLDFYGVPTAMFTVRLYYNKDLYRRIAGDRPLPATYDELIELCDLVHAYAQETGEVLIPIAGSQYNAPMILLQLWTSLTQKMALELSTTYNLILPSDQAWMHFLKGNWDYSNPSVSVALTAMREVGRHMQSGFLSLLRDDAMFYFVQGRALMTASGSWDIGSMYAQAPFEIAAFPIPMPSRNDPKYEDYILGPLSEAGYSAGAAFGLVQQSKHPEEALDFLRFITSQQGNQTFSDISLWLPSVIGVELPEKVKPFDLIVEGYTGGVVPYFGADGQRVFRNYLHTLLDYDGSPGEFATIMTERMPGAVIEGFRLSHAGRIRQWRRGDSLLGSLIMLSESETSEELDRVRLAETLEAAVDQETMMLWVESEFETMGLSLEY